jgi:hypothetical protein
MSADLLEGDDRPGNSDLSGSLLRPSRDKN